MLVAPCRFACLGWVWVCCVVSWCCLFVGGWLGISCVCLFLCARGCMCVCLFMRVVRVCVYKLFSFWPLPHLVWFPPFRCFPFVRYFVMWHAFLDVARFAGCTCESPGVLYVQTLRKFACKLIQHPIQTLVLFVSVFCVLHGCLVQVLDTRQTFLNLCQGNHYQFDMLRRGKHSSMMVSRRRIVSSLPYHTQGIATGTAVMLDYLKVFQKVC